MMLGAMAIDDGSVADSDPDWDDVVLLIPGDGTVGGYDYEDVSSSPSTLSFPYATEEPLISTTQKKFDGSSIYFEDQWYSRIDFPDSAKWDFGTGDYTIEAWIYPTLLTSIHTIVALGSWQETGTAKGLALQVNTGGLRLARNNSWFGYSGTISLNTWHHVAISRVSGTGYLCINGLVVNTESSTLSFAPAGDFAVGETPHSTGNAFKGYMEQIRITKGVGRYSGSYTVPAGPFPQH